MSTTVPIADVHHRGHLLLGDGNDSQRVRCFDAALCRGITIPLPTYPRSPFDALRRIFAQRHGPRCIFPARPRVLSLTVWIPAESLCVLLAPLRIQASIAPHPDLIPAAQNSVCARHELFMRLISRESRLMGDPSGSRNDQECDPKPISIGGCSSATPPVPIRLQLIG
jgi:hypothetical protein